jgi:hypothetical protein
MFEELAKQMFDLNIVTPEIEIITGRLNDRWGFLYNECHGLSYLLDPKYRGEHITKEEKKDLIRIMNTRCDDRTAAMELDGLNNYLDDISNVEDCFHQMHLSIHSGDMTPLKFWSCHSVKTQFPKISTLARKLFALVPSSSASERNFSTFSFVHSKLRNRLHHDKVTKLVYIKANGIPLRSHEKSPDDDDDDLYGEN